MNRTLKFALCSLGFNIAFSAYYLILGIVTRSWWLLTLASYYVILSIVRFTVLRTKKKKVRVTRFTGLMLTALSLPLAGTVILSVVTDRGTKFHLIVMLAIATYSFTKITYATVKLVKARHSASKKITALRSISFADATASIFALQRSMLVSFKGMADGEIQLMNALLGTAVSVTVFLLGLNLLRKSKSY